MPAPEFPVNTERYDPYLNYRFRIKWDGKYVAGVSKISGLKRTTERITYRPGGTPGGGSVYPGQSQFEAVTLERGVTHDKDFEQWANKVWSYGNASASPFPEDIMSLKDYRKDLRLELYNEAGQLVQAYGLYRCWVSEWQAMADLEGEGNAVLIQTIKVENEGWERDASVGEPTYPSYISPP